MTEPNKRSYDHTTTRVHKEALYENPQGNGVRHKETLYWGKVGKHV